MNHIDFVKETILKFDDKNFEIVKNALLGEFLSFSIIPEEKITKEILAEKLCDYFVKLEIKTGKSFNRQIDIYTDNIDDIVDRRVAWEPKPKKNEDTPAISRARKYYKKVRYIKDLKDVSMNQLIDYTRIALCLYMAYINNGYKFVKDFNYDKSCLNIDKIIKTMRTEQENGPLGIAKKDKFDNSDVYSSDKCTFILVIILVQKILQN